MNDIQTGKSPRARLRKRLVIILGIVAIALAWGVPSEAAKLINGNKLKNNSVTSKKIKNNNLTGKDVKNDSLKGADIKESSLKGLLRPGDVAAFGNASDTFIDNFTSGAFTPLISTTFDAPTDGVLHVTGAVSAEDDVTLGGTGQLAYRLRLDATPLTSETRAHELGYAGTGGAASGATTGVVPVTAGSHTVHLDGLELGTGSFIYGREVSVIFLPTGSGFTPPARTRTHRQ